MKLPICCLGLVSLLAAASAEAQKVLLHDDRVEHAYPRLSADDKQVLYQSNRSGKWQLFIMDIATGEQQAVLPDSFNNNFPDWHPEGKMIAFVSDRDGNEEIYLVNTDGTDLRRLTNDAARDIYPYFSPDGKYLLFNSTRANGSLDIFRYELATGKTEQLTNTPEDQETCARYSPDMKTMVFLRNNDERDDVFTMDLTTGLTENVSRTLTVRDGWPMFSNDGTWIYYSSMESQQFCIYRIKTDLSMKQQLTKAVPGEEDARVYVSHDNRFIVYNKRQGGTIDIRMLQL